MTKSRSIGRGGKRPGAGAPSFIPTPEQQAVVRLLIGSGRPHDEIVTAIKNPRTSKPISIETLHKAFTEEIRSGQVEMNTLAMTGLAGQLKGGNMTAIIWWSKNRMGWQDSTVHEMSGKNGGPIPIVITKNESLY